MGVLRHTMASAWRFLHTCLRGRTEIVGVVFFFTEKGGEQVKRHTAWEIQRVPQWVQSQARDDHASLPSPRRFCIDNGPPPGSRRHLSTRTMGKRPQRGSRPGETHADRRPTRNAHSTKMCVAGATKRSNHVGPGSRYACHLDRRALRPERAGAVFTTPTAASGARRCSGSCSAPACTGTWRTPRSTRGPPSPSSPRPGAASPPPRASSRRAS